MYMRKKKWKRKLCICVCVCVCVCKQVFISSCKRVGSNNAGVSDTYGLLWNRRAYKLSLATLFFSWLHCSPSPLPWARQLTLPVSGLLWCGAVIDSSSSGFFMLKKFCVAYAKHIFHFKICVSFCGCMRVCVCEGAQQPCSAESVYSDVLTCFFGSKQTVITGHHADKGETKVWLMSVLSLSLYSFPSPLFPSSVSSPYLFGPLPSQRTWMTCGWRAWQAWLHPAVSLARDAAPIILNRRPKLPSTSALGVPGKCFYLLLSGALGRDWDTAL